MFLIYAFFGLIDVISIAAMVFAASRIFDWHQLNEKQQIAVGELMLTSMFAMVITTGLMLL